MSGCGRARGQESGMTGVEAARPADVVVRFRRDMTIGIARSIGRSIGHGIGHSIHWAFAEQLWLAAVARGPRNRPGANRNRASVSLGGWTAKLDKWASAGFCIYSAVFWMTERRRSFYIFSPCSISLACTHTCSLAPNRKVGTGSCIVRFVFFGRAGGLVERYNCIIHRRGLTDRYRPRAES